MNLLTAFGLMAVSLMLVFTLLSSVVADTRLALHSPASWDLFTASCWERGHLDSSKLFGHSLPLRRWWLISDSSL